MNAKLHNLIEELLNQLADLKLDKSTTVLLKTQYVRAYYAGVSDTLDEFLKEGKK